MPPAAGDEFRRGSMALETGRTVPMRWLFSYDFVDQFAANLLTELTPSLSAPDPAGAKVKKAAKLQRQREHGLGVLLQRAVEFGRREKLNFFQRARLSKQLQDGLIRIGQPPELAKSVALDLISELK
jgi:hypothetical protein